MRKPSQAAWEKKHPPQEMHDGSGEVTTDYSASNEITKRVVGNPSAESEIETRFTYVAPKGDQPQRYVTLRAAGKELALLINRSCPPSREKELALTHLDSVIMFANASIARREK